MVEGLPGTLRLNEIQTIGTHNSFHLEPPRPFVNRVRPLYPDVGLLEYSHSPLNQQFNGERVRQIELDIYADTAGGRYAEPTLAPDFGVNPASRPEMYEPGFKVLHINDIDFLTTCTTFVRCLTTVHDWSEAHPGHLPIMILVEVHDTNELPAGLDFLHPAHVQAMTSGRMGKIDTEIRSVFGDDEMITPDDVRGDAATLNEAVLSTGWPTLADSAGQVLFALDNPGLRALYREGHDSLEGRAMFTPSEPGDPDGAFLKLNDPGPDIAERVAEGYLVRTRAENTTVQARSGDTTQRDAALASGAQWVSTDWPVPGRAARFGTDFVVGLPGSQVARCNPVNAATACAGLDPAPPSNDDFASARALAGRRASTTDTNVGATAEPGEPVRATQPATASVWYRWTAPRTGNLVVGTAGSDFDTVLAAYRGSTIAGLQRLAVNDDRNVGPHSRIAFPVVAGRTYRIAVDGAGGATGQAVLTWRM